MNTVEVMVNGRWPLRLPEERARREGWAWWEQDALAALWTLIRPGDVVWDVGAEQGDLSALYATWGARVVPIEPDPGCWPLIKATFDANKVAPYGTYACAIGREPSGACWSANGWPHEIGTTDPPEYATENRAYPVRTLDVILVSGRPDVVIMDIEGGEYQAILAAGHLLGEVRPALMISVHPEMMRDRYMDTPDDLVAHIERQGYVGHRVAYDHEHHWIFKPKP